MADSELGRPIQEVSGLRIGSSRRVFLKGAGVATGGAALLAGARFQTIFATSSPCPDSTQDIFNAALTAEQLASTFYFKALKSSSQQLPAVHGEDISYFQAGLWEEYQHALLFQSVGAMTLATLDSNGSPQFFFPSGTFMQQATFLSVLDALETAFISAYTAAIGEWAGDSSGAVSSVPGGFTAPQLAKIAAQILAVEAEHRALGRASVNMDPPNNRIIEEAQFVCVGSPTNSGGTAVGALLPFVTGGDGFEGPFSLPGAGAIRAAATAAVISLLSYPPLASP